VFTVRNIALLGLLAMASALSGCYMGRTTITTTDGRDYKIYGDGELLCESTSDCTIPQRGTPHTIELEAVKGNTVVGKTTISREITTSSIAWGFITYFVSLYVYQAYPDHVYIPLDYNNEILNRKLSESGGGDWNVSPLESKGSAWDAPMSMPVDDYDAPADEY